MKVLRKNRIPAIYLSIPWIRKPKGTAMWADLEDDIQYIDLMKSICEHKACLSRLEQLTEFLVTADFPEDWKEFEGTTGSTVEWKYCKWNAWDILTHINDDYIPSEAVSLREAGVTQELCDALAEPVSCIPILKLLHKEVNFGELPETALQKITETEQSLFRQLEIHRLKGSAHNDSSNRSGKLAKSSSNGLTPSVRKSILARDGYRCCFCGATSASAELEVDHIVSRSLIKRLELPPKLSSAEYNLATTCKSCNRGKRDFLSQRDVAHYIHLFSKDEHPNVQIMTYLEMIARLQSGDAI
jgi:hypothetical protein